MQTPNSNYMMLRPAGYCEKTDLYRIDCMDTDGNMQTLNVPMSDAMKLSKELCVRLDSYKGVEMIGPLGCYARVLGLV